MVIRKRILPKFGEDHTRIGADIIKTGFSENFPKGDHTKI